ncbi:MAG: hypothetical protein KDB35_08315, partial [Acidimicrobiales bacterium]|nr:hypothetical protein [Acidimicrobiales bacterium]
MSTTRARRVLAAAMVAVGLGMVAACTGVPVDESPEAISRSELPPQLLPSSTTTTVRPGEGDLVSVFLVRGSSTSDDALVNTLVAIPTVDTADLPAAVLEAVAQARIQQVEQYGEAIRAIEDEPAPRARPARTDTPLLDAFRERIEGRGGGTDAARELTEEILTDARSGLDEANRLLDEHAD